MSGITMIQYIIIYIICEKNRGGVSKVHHATINNGGKRIVVALELLLRKREERVFYCMLQ